MSTREIISIPEAAKRLCTSAETLYRYIDAGKISTTLHPHNQRRMVTWPDIGREWVNRDNEGTPIEFYEAENVADIVELSENQPGISDDNRVRELAGHAAAQRIMPHEFLAAISAGEPIEQRYFVDILDSAGNITGRMLKTETIYPDLPTRIAAAKFAAPYFAPKLAAQAIEVKTAGNEFDGMSDDQIDAELKRLGGNG